MPLKKINGLSADVFWQEYNADKLLSAPIPEPAVLSAELPL